MLVAFFGKYMYYFFNFFLLFIIKILLLQNISENIHEQLLARDMQAVGCILVEMFLSARLRILGPDATLAQRYTAIRKVCTRSMEELPR